MKNNLFLVVVLFSIGVSAQNIAKINSDLKLSDSLTYETEVRVYQSDGITNYSSLFRMFKDKSGKWTGEFYEHYAKIEGQTDLRIEKQILKPENELELVFQNFIRSHILDLPSLSEVKWKLVTRGNVEKVKIQSRGKMTEKYELLNKQVAILDGEKFKVQAKSLNKTNEFVFFNPDSYLEHYPDVDELIYMAEILNIVRSEFGVWEK